MLQTEQNAKYLEQQIALMRVQAEIGQEAARLHREEMSASKMRDRAVASIPNFKEGEDVQDFMITAERKLTAGGVRRERLWHQSYRRSWVVRGRIFAVLRMTTWKQRRECSKCVGIPLN